MERRREKIHCVRCFREYDPVRDRGTLECRFHYLPFNEDSNGEIYGKDHYECCGASPNRDDQRHHEKSLPIGCVSIDHVSDMDLFDHFIRVPYFCIQKDIADRTLRVVKSGIAEKGVKLISSYSQLDVVIDFKTFRGGTIKLSPRKLLNALLDGEMEEISDSATSAKSSAYYTYARAGKGSVKEHNFDPFYVIARVDCGQDPLKLREINYGEGDCPYREKPLYKGPNF